MGMHARENACIHNQIPKERVERCHIPQKGARDDVTSFNVVDVSARSGTSYPFGVNQRCELLISTKFV